MRSSKKEIPYAWFWFGKSLHKGFSRGERIRPIYINRDGEICTISRRSSRASLPTDKPARRLCEVHQDRSRSSSPMRSEESDATTKKCCCGLCSPVERESEASLPPAKCQCSSCQKSSNPNPPPRVSGVASPASSSRTITPVTCCYHMCPVSGIQSVAPFHDQFHQFHERSPLTPAPSPPVSPQMENRGKCTQAKCSCRQHVAPPEPEPKQHFCCHSDDGRAGESLYVEVGHGDDTVSEASIEATSESDRGDECHCGHFILGFPCGTIRVD